MSSLTDAEKRYLEKLLDMGGGYVLDFTDATFSEFFSQHNVDIDESKYRKSGQGKAKRLRAFWLLEPDQKVGEVLCDMLNSYVVECELGKRKLERGLLDKARKIANRLTGGTTSPQSSTTEAEFLAREFAFPNIQKLPIESHVISIVQARLDEARIVLEAGAHLSVIFLCGSVLEAVLLGAAQKSPAKFNQANAKPKAADGSPKRFHEWSLAQLIDVACTVGALKPDIKKFSHGLRDFRNYIHPYEQIRSGFTPDEHTAKLCLQVLKAALADLAGERP